MGMMSEFKTFAMKGNVMDLAVGVIIGGAFGKIVDSLVGDVVMPIVSAILGGKLDFSSFLIPLGKVPEGTVMTLDALKKAGVPVLASVAAILDDIWPDFPIPVTTTRPGVSLISLQAVAKSSSRRGRSESTARASISSTSRASAISSSLFRFSDTGFSQLPTAGSVFDLF